MAETETEVVRRDQSVKDQLIEMGLNVAYYGIMIGLTYLAYRFEQSPHGVQAANPGKVYPKG